MDIIDEIIVSTHQLLDIYRKLKLESDRKFIMS